MGETCPWSRGCETCGVACASTPTARTARGGGVGEVSHDGVDPFVVGEGSVAAVVADDEVHPHDGAGERGVEGKEPGVLDHLRGEKAETCGERGEVEGGVLHGLAEVGDETLARGDGGAELAEGRHGGGGRSAVGASGAEMAAGGATAAPRGARAISSRFRRGARARRRASARARATTRARTARGPPATMASRRAEARARDAGVARTAVADMSRDVARVASRGCSATASAVASARGGWCGDGARVGSRVVVPLADRRVLSGPRRRGPPVSTPSGSTESIQRHQRASRAHRPAPRPLRARATLDPPRGSSRCPPSASRAPPRSVPRAAAPPHPSPRRSPRRQSSRRPSLRGFGQVSRHRRRGDRRRHRRPVRRRALRQVRPPRDRRRVARRPGGAAHSWKRDGYTFESGPSLCSGMS